MPWRALIRMLMQDPRIKDKLSNSWPIRRAAQKSVYWFLRAEEKFREKGIDRASASRFASTFVKELKDGMKNLSDSTNANKTTQNKTQNRSKSSSSSDTEHQSGFRNNTQYSQYDKGKYTQSNGHNSSQFNTDSTSNRTRSQPRTPPSQSRTSRRGR